MKNFKIATWLRKILIEEEWAIEIIAPTIYGATIFAIVLWLDGRKAVSFFWGAFTFYMILGGFITLWRSVGVIFEKINIIIGVAMMMSGVAGSIYWPNIELLTWPLIKAGIILTVISLLGNIGKRRKEKTKE